MSADVMPGYQTVSPSRNQITGLRPTSIAASAYLFIILFMWGMFALNSGLPYETGFPYYSETSSLLQGFHYAGDPLRPNTNTFYHVAYLLSEIFAPGTFVPYQIVYAALWLARGLLLFIIVRRLLPDSVELAYIAGALTLVHASDGALQWVGQMNQFGFIFWMLLAFYFFVVASDSERQYTVAFAMLLAAVWEYMSLWSYESGLFIILLMPLALVLARWPLKRSGIVLCATWYVVPAIYILATVKHYLRSSGNSYQESVLRNDWSAASLASDLGFNVSASLCFWNWGQGAPVPVQPFQMALLATLAVAVFICGGVFIGSSIRVPEPGTTARSKWIAAALLCAGLLWVASSFPAYLLLNSARGLWRTQILSGPGAGMVFAGSVALLASAIPYRRIGYATALLLAAIIMYYGTSCAIQRGGVHRQIWESHRQAIAALLHAVPQVTPGTIIVLTNVPKERDPFGHDMWFDMALRLAYPGTRVTGVYFFDDGTAAPGNNLTMTDGRWQWDGKSFGPLITSGKLDQTIIVQAGGVDRVLEQLPDFLCSKSREVDTYMPHSRMAGTLPSRRAIRRYGPL